MVTQIVSVTSTVLVSGQMYVNCIAVPLTIARSVHIFGMHHPQTCAGQDAPTVIGLSPGPRAMPVPLAMPLARVATVKVRLRTPWSWEKLTRDEHDCDDASEHFRRFFRKCWT